MTNKELLEIIKIAKENSINVDTIKRVLTLVEQDGEISPKKVNQIAYLFQKEEINDKELLNILEKAYQRKLPVTFLFALNHHPLIKRTLIKMNFEKKEWKIILEFVSNLPEDIVIDSLYIKWLRYIGKRGYLLDELQFFHQAFKESLNTPLIYCNWYFEYLLDKTRSLKNRENILTLLKQNILNMLQENIRIENPEIKAQKIMKCYELYGDCLTSFYATIITCIIDIDIPIIENNIEVDLYKILYQTMCYTCENNMGSNFINSFYYKQLTDKKIDATKRLEFITIINSKELILKDELIKELLKVYEEKGKEFLKELKYAFLNKGIRTDILCKSFLVMETDLQVLKLAREVFRNNRVRKDKENLCVLCNLKTSAEKIEFLTFLKNKYQDDIEVKMQKERDRQEKACALLKAYKDFFNKKIGLSKLEESLENAKELDINIVRIRGKENG